MNALETAMLGKRYGHTWALRDCSLAVPAGRAVALVGPNGAGKTTLLHLAVGLAAPTSGAIVVLGDLVPGSDEALSRVGFVAQDTPLYPGLSVADTIRLVDSLSDSGVAENARQRLTALDIPLDRKVGRLSGGQRAQVALAITLARRPELLILDEPVARLDPLARHEFTGTVMAAVVEEGISVLFSSHVVSELERICDYLIVLGQGRLQVSGEVDTLLESHKVLTGPTEEASAVAATIPTVWATTAGRQSRLLVRTTPATALPPAWQADPTNLEELVLGYLRSPEATAFGGPRPEWHARAEGVPA
jgi:ABC-2 type transport system ATP-binding protein